MRKHLFCILGIGLALTVGGCGGSGNSDSPSPTPTTQVPIDPNLEVPVQAAFAHIVNNGFNQSFTISGWIDQSTGVNPIPPTPITGSGHLTLGTAVGATVCSFAALAATEVVTGTTIANGVSTPFATTGTIYYRSDNTTLATYSAGELFLYSPYAYPATVRAGNTGSTGNGTKVVDPNCTQTRLTSTGAYTVASDGATSLLVTFITDKKNPFTSAEDKTSTVYRIDTKGNVSLVSITALTSFLGSVYQTLIFTF